MKRLLFFVPVGLFVVLVGFFAVGLSMDPKVLPSPLIGKPAPVFSLPLLKTPDRMIQTSDLKGQVTLLNVWATWCAACAQEHATLVQIAKSGVVPIYGLDYKDSREKALVWLKERGDPYVASAFDADGRVAIDWGVYGAPETFVLDRNGIVRYKHVGPLTPAFWTQTLLPMIRELKDNKGDDKG